MVVNFFNKIIINKINIFITLWHAKININELINGQTYELIQWANS